MKYVPDQPQQGLMYHRLNTIIAAHYSGLGPQNVAQRPYNLMVGTAFQKPLSGSSTTVPTVESHRYR